MSTHIACSRGGLGLLLAAGVIAIVAVAFPTGLQLGSGAVEVGAMQLAAWLALSVAMAMYTFGLVGACRAQGGAPGVVGSLGYLLSVSGTLALSLFAALAMLQGLLIAVVGDAGAAGTMRVTLLDSMRSAVLAGAVAFALGHFVFGVASARARALALGPAGLVALAGPLFAAGLMKPGILTTLGALSFAVAIVSLAAALFRQRASLPPPRPEMLSMREQLPSMREPLPSF